MSDINLLIILLVVALVFIAFFFGINIAFIHSNRLSIELRKKQGKSSGIILSKFLEKPSGFLGICLFGFTVFLVLYALLFNSLMKTTLWNPLRIDNVYLKLAFDSLIAAFFLLLFGIFLPRTVFKAKSDTLLFFFSPLIQFFYSLFQPVASAFVKFSGGILEYLFNLRMKSREEPFVPIDLEYFLQQKNEQDENNQEMNKELLQNALSLPALKVRQCLIPRTEIKAIDAATSIEEARRKLEETKLSRLIVYDGNIDNITGYIHQLDMFKQPQSIQSILLPIVVIPESMNATDLLNRFTRERKSIAWVVDEFGGTAGIITMEDVLEEIFGEIKDEYDVEDFLEKQINENEFIFPGRTELDYLREKYDLEFLETEAETLSGYIINAYEKIPKPKDRIIINKYEFDILNVSDTRIEMVKLKILR